MNRFILSREYGELAEGFQASRADLLREVSRGELADPRRVADFNRECADWAETMRACPMFVGGAL